MAVFLFSGAYCSGMLFNYCLGSSLPQQLFISSAVFGVVLQEKKKKRVEQEGCRGLARKGFAGRLGIWAGEAVAGYSLFASFCIILSLAGHLSSKPLH